RHALNYVVACYFEEERKDDGHSAKGIRKPDARRKAQVVLEFNSYFVQPVLRKTFGDAFLGLSATIGDAGIWKFETGLDVAFHRFGSGWSPANTRIFLPTDVPWLGTRAPRVRGHVTPMPHKTVRLKSARKMIVNTACGFAEHGIRSLIVVPSNGERSAIVSLIRKDGIDARTYGNGISAQEAATLFRNGEGDCLVGTPAQYAEGVDLPQGTAPVILVMKPAYAPPSDPQRQFEGRRFTKGQYWMLQQWRAMIEALQVRGRNMRSETDVGVAFFFSQQYGHFLYGCLPEWLRPAYRNGKTLEECVRETYALLQPQSAAVGG
ncbi:hypothetical protein HYV72_02365, partial [Candidatus Uhrbacteria bacterium]|nr:hypothetical protein [Candidatus Uhrbacteria bacterium]